MVPILIMNMANGFSGLSTYRDLYYALYTITLTLWMVAPYLGLEQDISVDFQQYKLDAHKTIKPNNAYNPNKVGTL